MNDSDKNEAIVTELIRAYWMELETVLNFIANSTNLDGVRAEEIKKSLAADVQEELTHATQLANRIKTIDGKVPGSFDFKAILCGRTKHFDPYLRRPEAACTL